MYMSPKWKSFITTVLLDSTRGLAVSSMDMSATASVEIDNIMKYCKFMAWNEGWEHAYSRWNKESR